MYDYFTNKSKHRLIVKNKHKFMTIYYKNRTFFLCCTFLSVLSLQYKNRVKTKIAHYIYGKIINSASVRP